MAEEIQAGIELQLASTSGGGGSGPRLRSRTSAARGNEK